MVADHGFKMKAYSMLNGTESKKNYKDENSMPVLNFTNADVVMDYAKDNGIKVRGHVLVWDAICELVKSINSTLPDGKGGYVKLCDGIGMQSYIGGWYSGNVDFAQNGCMQDSDIERIKTAIEKFADLGMEVQATELAIRNFLGDEETMKKHGAFYKKLFQAYIDINKMRADKPFKAVSIWGIVDDPDMKPGDPNYRMNGPYCGLFDETLAVKPAFTQVYDLLKNGN